MQFQRYVQLEATGLKRGGLTKIHPIRISRTRGVACGVLFNDVVMINDLSDKMMCSTPC